jgi:hypothetical protein
MVGVQTRLLNLFVFYIVHIRNLFGYCKVHIILPICVNVNNSNKTEKKTINVIGKSKKNIKLLTIKIFIQSISSSSDYILDGHNIIIHCALK